MFKTGQALLLVKTRFSRPRRSRAADPERSRSNADSWPQTRHFRGHELVQGRAHPHIVHFREQSASMSFPRPQSCPQTIHVPAQATVLIVRGLATATDADCPQAIHSHEQSTSVNWSHPRFGHGRGQATDYPRHCIDVAIRLAIQCPLIVRIIPTYVLI
jgi:hypothetical protein